MSKAAEKRAEIEEAENFLRAILKPGQTVYVVQRHVSSSGMLRRLSLFVMKDNKPHDITRKAALVTGYAFDRDTQTMKVGGTGMNMHFAAVYSLSSSLWPDGVRCTGKRETCFSNDHSNDYNLASHMFDKVLADRGEERDYGSGPDADAQHAERRAYIDEQIDNGPLGYRRGRKHRDGGYALNYATL